ncbi:Kinase [Spironucleus salmonicida]|uniref:Kinase n=1 Tax=Spironucleus salmonicida TaxID=348837 RepID=V6LDD9_9EUKA|nr:Kinase [Spironucleus salmonicida]|eukprot:EST42497.1 Kinase [Spironucleus salmonicida]
MTYLISELQFLQTSPIDINYSNPLQVITQEQLETLVDFVPQQPVRNPQIVKLACFSNKILYIANETFVQTWQDGIITNSYDLKEKIIKIFPTPNGISALSEDNIHIIEYNKVQKIHFQATEILTFNNEIYARTPTKIIKINKKLELLTTSKLRQPQITQSLIFGINHHNRLSCYDLKNNCRGYLQQNLKISSYTIYNNIIICFTKCEKLLTLGIELQGQRVVFKIIGKLSAPIWMQGAAIQEKCKIKIVAGELGIAVMRAQSVACISYIEILSKISKKEIENYRFQFDVCQEVIGREGKEVDAAVVSSVIQGIGNIIQGEKPFKDEIELYCSIFKQYQERYNNALYNQCGNELCCQNELEAELNLIQDSYIQSIQSDIPEKSQNLDFNKTVFSDFCLNFDSEDYEKSRAKCIQELKDELLQEKNNQIQQLSTSVSRKRIVMEDCFYGFEAGLTFQDNQILESIEPQSDPLAENTPKVVKKVVIIRKVIKKVIKSSEKTENQQPATNNLNTTDTEAVPKQPAKKQSLQPSNMEIKQEDAPAPKQPSKIKKVAAINTVVIKRPKKAQIETKSEDSDPIENDILSTQKSSKQPVAAQQYQSQPLQFLQQNDTQSPLILAQKTAKTTQNLTQTTRNITSDALQNFKSVAQTLTQKVQQKTEEAFPQLFTSPFQFNFQESNPHKKLFTSRQFAPDSQAEISYETTSNSIMKGIKTLALAQFDIFNQYARFQENQLMQEIVFKIRNQIQLFAPTSQIFKDRFIVFPANFDFPFLLAYDTFQHKFVSCKIMPKFMANRENQLFFRTLKHDNLLQIFTFAETENSCLIFTEKAPQISIKTVLENRIKLFKSEKMIKNVAKQLLYVIQYLNNLKIIHRELDPNNILYDIQNNQVKIFSTGFIQQYKEEVQYLQTCYQPPEIICGIASHSSNVWAIGTVIYKLIELLFIDEPLNLFEFGEFSSDCDLKSWQGEQISQSTANNAVLIMNQVSQSTDVRVRDGMAVIYSLEEMNSIMPIYNGKIEITSAFGKLPWQEEVEGAQREGVYVLDALQEFVSAECIEFLEACWVFDFSNRNDPSKMLEMDWFKDE